MQENYAKISKIKQLEAIGARRATWWGHLTPPCCRPAWHFQCHLTNPWEVAKKHTSKPSPPLIPSRFKIKGRKEASHGLMTHHPVCGVLKWTNGVHTHTLLHPKGPHTEGGGPTPQRHFGRAPYLGCQKEAYTSKSKTVLLGRESIS